MRPVAGRSAGNDSVEILGIPLRFHQRLTSAIGASVEITARRRAAEKISNNRLRLQIRLMHRAIPEIDQLLRVSDRPCRAGATLMTVVGRRRGITPLHRLGKPGRVDRPCPAAIAKLQIFSIPSARRDPQLEMDLGVLCRPDDSLHGTVGGSDHGSRAAAPAAAHRSFRNSRRGSNRRVFERDTHQSLARLFCEERRG